MKKHKIIRQIELVRFSRHFAVGKKQGGIVEPSFDSPRDTDDDGWAAVLGISRQITDRQSGIVLERLLENKILGWVPDHYQFGRHDKVGARGRSLSTRLSYKSQVTGQISHGRVELGHGDVQTIGHGGCLARVNATYNTCDVA